MIKSMTGYGKRSVTTSIGNITIEVRAVNNRYIEVYPRIPDFLSDHEIKLTRQIKEALQRGSINLKIEVEEQAEGREILHFNSKKLKNIYSSLSDIKYSLDLDDDVTIDHILQFSDKLLEEDDIATETVCQKIKEGLKLALQDVDGMRREEGQALYDRLQDYIEDIEKNIKNVVSRSDNIKDELYEKYKSSIKDLLDESDIDEDRILQEAALAAKKIDITEECDRIASHVQQFRKYMDSEKLAGKQLNFLAQEIHRELNTIGAKCNNSEISHIIVESKNEVEKIKEQVRNIL
ncbi:MAG TPA: YicC/YloC family endoribonuclease [bacterium]|nr:YicC/YloC family endoribonuclease [bacterium]